jgi:hypothetical protein
MSVVNLLVSRLLLAVPLRPCPHVQRICQHLVINTRLPWSPPHPQQYVIFFLISIFFLVLILFFAFKAFTAKSVSPTSAVEDQVYRHTVPTTNIGSPPANWGVLSLAAYPEGMAGNKERENADKKSFFCHHLPSGYAAGRDTLSYISRRWANNWCLANISLNPWIILQIKIRKVKNSSSSFWWKKPMALQ